MLILVPLPDFSKSMRVMDYVGLKKQRVETYQILKCLEKPKAWKHHPSVQMWTGYQEALKQYYNESVMEWIRRGHPNNMQLKPVNRHKMVMPEWWGQTDIPASHRAALLASNPEWYARFGWPEAPKVDYVWPNSITTESDLNALS